MISTSFRNPIRPLAAALLLLLLAAGCDKVSRAELHGTVKWNGRPLTDTTVIFMGADNMTYPVDLKADGTYEVKGVPRGRVRVSVQQSLPSVVAKANPGKGSVPKMGETKDAKLPESAELVKKQGARLPVRYANPEQSGLDFDLTDPRQEWSVDLK